MWNKLPLADRANYIKLGVQNGITDLGIIRSAYNKYAGGGQMPWSSSDMPIETGSTFSSNPQYQDAGRQYAEQQAKKEQKHRRRVQAAETVASYTPIVGTVMDINEAIDTPSAQNIGWAGASLLSDILGGRLVYKGAQQLKKTGWDIFNKVPAEWISGAGVFGVDAGINTIQQNQKKANKKADGGPYSAGNLSSNLNIRLNSSIPNKFGYGGYKKKEQKETLDTILGHTKTIGKTASSIASEFILPTLKTGYNYLQDFYKEKDEEDKKRYI